jgi:hypothetical protein
MLQIIFKYNNLFSLCLDHKSTLISNKINIFYLKANKYEKASRHTYFEGKRDPSRANYFFHTFIFPQ